MPNHMEYPPREKRRSAPARWWLNRLAEVLDIQEEDTAEAMLTLGEGEFDPKTDITSAEMNTILESRGYKEEMIDKVLEGFDLSEKGALKKEIKKPIFETYSTGKTEKEMEETPTLLS